MKLTLSLVKNCSKVDKYQMVDTNGKPVEKDPQIGPVYLAKEIVKGAKQITITVAAC